MDILVKDIDDYIRSKLGAPSIGDGSIELTPDQVLVHIKEALRTYNEQYPPIRPVYIATIAGGRRYELPLDVTGILEVQPQHTQPGYRIDDLNLIEINRSRVMDLDQYAYQRLNLAQVRSMLALEMVADLYFEPVGSPAVTTPVAYLSNVNYAGQMTLICTYDAVLAKLPGTEPVDYVVKDLRKDDADWFYKYNLALAKQAIGFARRKWESELKLDGSSLVNEGTNEVKDLFALIQRKGSNLRLPIRG